MKVYHQQGAQLNDPDQNIEFMFGENNKYHQVGNSYLQFDITVRKSNNADFRVTDDAATNEVIRLVNNAFAHCFKEAVILTTGGMEIENIKFLGQVSTIMRALTSKDGDLLSHFDQIDETPAASNYTSLKQMLINNHIEANRGKIRGQLLLEDIFGFCKTFKKTKNLGFHITLKTNDLQNIIFATLAIDINVTINCLYLFVLIISPNSETQVMFKESNKNIYTITFDSWYTERKIVTDGGEFQVDIASSQSTHSPNFLLATHQTEAGVGTVNRANNISIFDHVDVKKYFVEIDGYRYPKESSLTLFSENDYLDQYRDFKSFYKEYVGEQLMNPFIKIYRYEKKYPIKVIDLRQQIDHMTPKKIQLFEENKNDHIYANKRLYGILIRHINKLK